MKSWRKVLSVICALLLFMTTPGMTVLADELCAEIVVAAETIDSEAVSESENQEVLESTKSANGEKDDEESIWEVSDAEEIESITYPEQDETEGNLPEGISCVQEESAVNESITDSAGEVLDDFLYPDLSESVQLANDMVQLEELVGSIDDSVDNPYITEEMLLETYNFDLAKYRADLLIEHYETSITTYMSLRNPSDILIESLENNEEFMIEVATWESVNSVFDPGSVHEDVVLDQVQCYELILLNALDQQLNDSSLVEALTGNISQNYYEVASAVLNALGVDYKCAINNEADFKKYMGLLNSKASDTKLNKLTSKQKTKIIGELEARIEGLEKVSDYMTIMKNLVSACESVYDLAQKCAALEQIAWLEADLSSALNELYEQCPKDNIFLLMAIKEVKNSCESTAASSVANVFLNTSVTVANEAFKMSMDAVWGGILASCSNGYFVYVLAGQKVGQFISNFFFCTDEIIESFVKMRSYCEVMDLINKSYYSLKNKYDEDPSTENANALLSIVNMIFNTKEAGCDYAKEYADVVYKHGIWNKITNASKSESYTNFVTGCNSIKDSYCFVQDRLMNRDWLIYLSDEYPDIYKVITHAFVEEYEYISVEGISLLNEKVTWQIDEPLLGVCANVVPSNASNQKINYTSSDPSVVKIIDGAGGCKALSEGTAVITAVTDEGGYEAKLTVTVVAKQPEDEETEELKTGESFSSGNYTYAVLADGTVSVGSTLSTSARRRATNVSLTIPERVNYKGNSCVISRIQNGGFEYFENVKYIRIPSTVKDIGYDAFESCIALETINLENVVDIGSDAFLGCSHLKTANLKSASILRSACFRACYALRSVSFNKACSLEESAFRACRNLVNVIGSSKIIEIGESAFESTGIEKFEFSPELKRIYENAFLNCQKLNEFVLPDTYIPVQLKCLEGSAWYSAQSNGIVYLQNYVLGYKGNIEDLTSLIINDDIEYIAYSAFLNAINLQSVTFPSELSCIGFFAFGGCKNLKELAFPENLKTIKDYAFKDCSALEKVTYTSCDFSLDDPYSGCSSLKEMVIDCPTANNIEFPSRYEGPELILSFSENVKAIDGKYQRCGAVKGIKIGTNIKSIKQGAFDEFWNCTKVEYNAEECDTTYRYLPESLENAVIGNNVKKIPAKLFDGCKKLSQITFKKATNLHYIGSDAFKETLWIQNELQNFVGAYYIGKCLYKYCGTYPSDEIVIDEGTVMICQDAFKEQSSAKSVRFPESLEYIGESAFAGCFGNNEVTIDMSKTKVVSVEDYAFYFNEFSQVIFSNCIKSIGDLAFAGYHLNYIKIPDTVIALGSIPFVDFNAYGLSNHDCTNWAVYLSDSVQEINETFAPTGTTMYCKVDGSAEKYLKEKGYKDIYYINEEFPEFAMDKDKTYIHDYLGNVSKIRLPDSVTKVGYDAFKNCRCATVKVDCPNVDVLQDLAITNEGQMTNAFGCLDNVVLLRFGKDVKKLKDNFTDQFSGLTKIVFEGDCPENIETILDSGKYHIYIPDNNISWDKIKSEYKNVVWNDISKASVTPVSITEADIEGIDVSYEYTGKEFTPEISVKVSGVTLNPERDYKVSYENNVEAGTASVCVSADGNYTGKRTMTFTINKAEAKLVFNSTTVNKVINASPFVNKLTQVTDGNVAFSSSDSLVATVNKSSGKVTINGLGSTIITVAASEGRNYKAASTSYILIVTTQDELVSKVGDGVTASFNKTTGTVKFFSNEGVLWEDWIEESGFAEESIESIKVAFGTVYLPEDSSNIFSIGYYDDSEEYYVTNLNEVNLRGFNTSKVTDMSYMFSYCENLNNLDLSGFDTSNVTDMEGMFDGCSSLTSLDLSGFDTSNVTDMYWMFNGCSSLTNLDLSGFDTSKVTNMAGMFEDCSNMTRLNLSGFDTSNVEYMDEMFYGCSSLISLDLSGFDTSNVENMDDIFMDCAELQLLKTPKKNEMSVELPVIMFDDNGNEYEELPAMSKSIVLSSSITNTRTDISDCEIILSATSYIYDGKAKKPGVTVKMASTTLTAGTDFTVSYAGNTNVGTATVKVTGIGEYKGEKSTTFTINKAAAKLAFAENSVTKKTTDTAFTNALTKTTDGTVTFKSSNTSVATVNSTNGLVTIKGVGTATITATAAEGKNYKAGSKAYLLTVKALASTTTPTPTASGFSDVRDPKHAYYKAIYWAADAGITKGYSDGTFGIDRSCTRGEMMMFLWRYAGKPSPKTVSKSPFKDVPMTHTFYKAILWGSQKGITKGYSDGTFGINRNVSRGECMMFLWRLKGKPAPTAVSKSPFTDVPKNHVFYNAILWGAQKKITTGYTSGAKKGTFGINENCTRGQIVTFLYRAK